MADGSGWRRLLFGFAVVALIGAAAALAGSAAPQEPAAHPPGGREARGRAPGLAPARALMGSLRRSARRFLDAYLRYEAGELGFAVRRALRWTATRRFAAALLGAPVRRRGPPLRAARLGSLAVRIDPADPRRALIEGLARRGPLRESLAFGFLHVARGWRASGAGE